MPFKRFEFLFFKNENIIHKETYKNVNKKNSIEFYCLGYHTILDLETDTFVRENDEFEFFLAIQKKYCTIHLKKEKMEFEILVEDCHLKKEKNQITLEYTIESEDDKNKIMIIVKD